jgi:hypothetical protein
MKRVDTAINRYQILLLIDDRSVIVICVIVEVACEGIAFGVHQVVLRIVGVFGLNVDLYVEVFDLIYLYRITLEVTCGCTFLSRVVCIEANFVSFLQILLKLVINFRLIYIISLI